jgi:hypothetical protein
MREKTVGSTKSFAWKECDDCMKKTRHIRIYRGEFLCYSCYYKRMTIMPQYGANCISLRDALKKTREVKGYCYGQNESPKGVIFVPRVLIGRKVKVVLAEEGKKK